LDVLYVQNSIFIYTIKFHTTRFTIDMLLLLLLLFNSSLFMCRINSYKANYRHSMM
jgi:hypothetical protein